MRRWLLKKRSGRAISDERGMSLIEVIIILVVMGIAVVPLGNLFTRNMVFGGRYATMTRAIHYCQEWMEQIISDYAADGAGRGYDWVRSNWDSMSDTPDAGYSRSVTISSELEAADVGYVVVQVTVIGQDIQNVVLTTWLIGEYDDS